ncbi:hypothetical protein [Prochlorococcus sp. MIT 1307]|uniref:tetratricopeptide repeat protein n=1 Tax=Prochlorococcus sp. MIT 1307 TaxID=3096219 RepID=UPI002A7474B9|nr:hypothetical protein [Prochlorococcus sp. MIT 1307]
MTILKKEITRKTSLALLTSLYCLLPAPSLANPSEAYKEKSDCIDNPDFVTPKDKTFKYCIKSNGMINKVNEQGELIQEKGQLNKAIEDRVKKGWGRSSISLYEYKIEEDELVQYTCKAKKVDSEYQCDGPGERLLKGVRPDGYYLQAGLKNIEDENWQDAIENFTSEIELTKNKDAYYQRAFAKYMVQDYLGAVKDSNIKLKADKNNIQALNLSSMAKYEINDYKGSINDLNKLVVLWEKLNEEEREELDLNEINPNFDKFYFRRALSKSKTGDNKGAAKDFEKAIEIDPLNGQAYFQKGLEKFWDDRDEACTDILKGISLGAEDTSNLLIKEKANTDSFLDELFDEETSLVAACKGIDDKKIEQNKENYEFEKFTDKASELLRKYFILIPIFLVVVLSLVMKYSNKDE